jgi:hypothetical protein
LGDDSCVNQRNGEQSQQFILHFIYLLFTYDAQ